MKKIEAYVREELLYNVTRVEVSVERNGSCPKDSIQKLERKRIG